MGAYRNENRNVSLQGQLKNRYGVSQLSCGAKPFRFAVHRHRFDWAADSPSLSPSAPAR